MPRTAACGRTEEAFRPEIVELVAKLRPGETSHLINLDGWGFIVRKEAEKQEKRLSFAEAYDQIAANVQKTARKTRYAAWIARLRDQAFIKRYPIPSEK